MTSDDVPGASRPTRRLTATSLVVWALLALGLPLAALTLNAVKFAGFPFGYWVTAQGALLGLVALALIYARRAGGDRQGEGAGGAVRLAADLISGAVFLAFAGAIAALGYDGLALPLGVVAGAALLAILIVPRFALYPVRSLAEFFDVRFASPALRWLVFIVAAISGTLMLAADLRAAGLAYQALTGQPFALGAGIMTVLVILVWLTAGIVRRGVPAGMPFVALICAFLLPVFVLAVQLGYVPLPHFTYGYVLADAAEQEIKLITQKLADVRALKPMASPFLQLSMLNFAGIVLALAFGIAALPHVLQRHFSAAEVRPGAAAIRAARGALLVALFVAGIAAFAVLARAALAASIGAGMPTSGLPPGLVEATAAGWLQTCGSALPSAADLQAACAKLPGSKGSLRLQDIVFGADAYAFAVLLVAAVPAVVIAVFAAGAAFAGLNAGHALLSSVVMTDAQARNAGDLAAGGLDGRMALIATLMVMIALLIGVRAVTDIVGLVSEGFALVAAGLFPALVLALYWRRMTGAGAIAAILVGFAAAGAYIIGTRLLPVAFFELTGVWSNAAPTAVRKFADLQAALAAASASGDSLVRDAAEAALSEHARGVANWWGLRPAASVLFAVPAAFVAGILVSLLTRRRPTNV
ncbi:MAG: sodium:solute symporter family transporter [Hyphomicrobium sp.]